MSERINIDLDRITGDGSGLYAATTSDGLLLFEPRPDNAAHIDGDYVTQINTDDTAVYVTTIADDGTVEILNAETLDFIDSIHDAELDGDYIPADVLDDYGLIALELIN